MEEKPEGFLLGGGLGGRQQQDRLQPPAEVPPGPGDPRVDELPLPGQRHGLPPGRGTPPPSGRAMETIRENYPRPAFYSCMNMLGTHDNPRILTLLGTYPKEAPPTPRRAGPLPDVPGGVPPGLPPSSRLGASFSTPSPAPPTIFYGDEAGMEGYEGPLQPGDLPLGAGGPDAPAAVRPAGQPAEQPPVPPGGGAPLAPRPGPTAWPLPGSWPTRSPMAATIAGDDPLFLSFDWPGDLATDRPHRTAVSGRGRQDHHLPAPSGRRPPGVRA